MIGTRYTQVVRFGVFEANLSARELRKHGVRVRLSGQPFAILSILLEQPGEVITREELQQRLWSKDTFVDFEHSLNSAIKKLRSALGDTPENSRYVETIPRIGYRFIAPIQRVSGKVSPTPEIEVGKVPAEEANRTPQSTFGPWLLLAGISVFVITASVLTLRWSRMTAQPQPSGGRVMIAVLPFENLTGDPAQDYFSDGLTEEMIDQLGRIDPQRLGVIARTSVTRYKHEPVQLSQLKKDLGVQYVLEGTVRRDSERVRITAKLIQMKDQTDVWSRKYDRSLDKVLVLQGEIAQELASGLMLTFDKRGNPSDAPSLSANAYQAYDLYLKGRYFWNKRTPEGFDRALDWFQQSTAKDPSYARSYAGMADTYAMMATWNWLPSKVAMPKARAAALRAVELDERLPEGHTSLAVIAQNYEWDWATAEKEYRRAIELDPNYSTAHHWYAEELALVGRFDEAVAEIDRARQLDPLSLIIGSDRAVILYFSRKFDPAIDQFRTVLDMEPSFPRARMVQEALILAGRYDEALADLEKWHALEPKSPWEITYRIHVYNRLGKSAQSSKLLAELIEMQAQGKVASHIMALAYTGMNDKDKAFLWLERSYSDHSISNALAVDPIYDPLRADPRFHTLLNRMHFDQKILAAQPGTAK